MVPIARKSKNRKIMVEEALETAVRGEGFGVSCVDDSSNIN